MQFLKKHYEKVLLGLVLLGLMIVVFFLLFFVSTEKKRLADLRTTIISRRTEPFKPLDLSRTESLLKRSGSAVSWDFSTKHKLFNPERWVISRNGQPTPSPIGELTGLEITKIDPLFFSISLDSVATNTSGARYTFLWERQAVPQPSLRRKRFYASLGEKVPGAFVLREVKGPPENPDELILELADSGERVSVSKDKPYKVEEGYTADLKYVPDNKSFLNLRKDSSITFGGEQYKIVDIKRDEVILSDSSTKKYTIRK